VFAAKHHLKSVQSILYHDITYTVENVKIWSVEQPCKSSITDLMREIAC